MNVRIIGDSPAATLLAGLLALEKHEVIWNPDVQGDRRLKQLKRRKEIRLILPQGWVRTENFRLSPSLTVKSEELGVVAVSDHTLAGLGPPASRPGIGLNRSTLLVLNYSPDSKPLPVAQQAVALKGLSLLEAVEWDPGGVEVTSQPWLLVEKNPLLREFVRGLRAVPGRQINIQEVEEVSAYGNSLFLRDLLGLPVAMCHSTLSNFLSFQEGRELAVNLLEEGMRVFSLKELPLKRLPVLDPQDLLQRLEKRAKEFEHFRNLPDRSYGGVLLHILRQEAGAGHIPNHRLVRMSAQTGFDPRWNWSLIQKLSRVKRVGFYKDPVDLHNAIR
jgi:hypothetical protein